MYLILQISSQCISADEDVQQRVLPFFSGRIPLFFSSGLETLGNSASFLPNSNLFSGQVPNTGASLPGSSGSGVFSQLFNFNSATDSDLNTNLSDSDSSNHTHNGLFGLPSFGNFAAIPSSGFGSLRPSILPNVSSFFNLPFIPGVSQPPSTESITAQSTSELESSQPETTST